jgi:carboxymethylenebutenolidase
MVMQGKRTTPHNLVAPVSEIELQMTQGTERSISAEDIYNPRSQFSRRTFIVNGLAAGFALAVLPVSAETIKTDTNGLTTREIEIPVKGGAIPGYCAMPATGGPFPTILVVQEVFGVHEHIKDICRRLAKAGYFAVAPALYAREGDVTRMSDMKQIREVVAKVPERQVASDLDATAAWAKSTKKADISKLGIVGFCWGGRQVWLYAEHNPQLKAGVAWYGVLERPKNDMTRRTRSTWYAISTLRSLDYMAGPIPLSPSHKSTRCARL